MLSACKPKHKHRFSITKPVQDAALLALVWYSLEPRAIVLSVHVMRTENSPNNNRGQTNKHARSPRKDAPKTIGKALVEGPTLWLFIIVHRPRCGNIVCDHALYYHLRGVLRTFLYTTINTHFRLHLSSRAE